MRCRVAVACLLCVSLVTSACAPSAVEVGVSADGTAVELRQGQELAVTLESNPSTGYSWQVVSGANGVVEQVGEPRFEAPSGEAVGASGVEVLAFEAVGPGSTRIELEYRRPWETTATPAETFSLDVTVE